VVVLAEAAQETGTLALLLLLLGSICCWKEEEDEGREARHGRGLGLPGLAAATGGGWHIYFPVYVCVVWVVLCGWV